MTPSKSTEKLAIVADIIAELPQENIKRAEVTWKVIDLDGDEMAVPVINVEYFDGSSKNVEVNDESS